MTLNRKPDIWYDPSADMVYSIGGDSYVFRGSPELVHPPLTLWGFKPTGTGGVDWEAQPWSSVGGSAIMTSNIAGGLTATTPRGHYSLGGTFKFVSDQSRYLILEELFSYNFGNKTWSNQTLAGLSRSYSHNTLGGGVYVPSYGTEGVILFFGGNSPSNRDADSTTSLKDMHEILVYDIHNDRFYIQQALNAPRQRYNFCSVGAGAANNGSYEV